MAQLDLIAAMAFGLESVVADELAALGYKSKTLGNGRVLFRADLRAMVRANLWLRAADRVLLRLGTFAATDFGQLFDGVYALPWEAWLGPDAAFPVNGRSVKSQLSSVPACQKIVKKAIVERLRKAHRVQTLPESGPACVVEIALLNDEATLTLDTTGPGLNKRGYRTLVGEAQLKETLAAALVMLSGWQPEKPLVDPFCGTGTIAIEAALLARNLAPGLNRTFAAESWAASSADLWSEARTEARELAQPKLNQPLLGSDINAAALKQARFHALQAGVEADVQFQVRNFMELASGRRQGLLLCNPPYGERLATRREAELLYRAMPAVFSRLPTWSFGVLTSHPRFERLVGHKADSRRKLYNGQIECWFYHYRQPRFPSGDDRIIQRYARRPAQHVEAFSSANQREMFANCLTNRARHLRKWPSRGITCFRLYERDMPEVPLVIDRYENCLHIVERPRPHDRTLAEHHRWLESLTETAVESLAIAQPDLFLKRYSDRLPLLQAASSASFTHVAHENGLKYHVNLRDFLETGLPLDLRTLRGMIRKLAAGKRVLSLFGSTGTLAAAAAAGGAGTTMMIDPSPVHVHWALANMALNGSAAAEHQAICCPPADFLRADSGNKYDLITIENPTEAEHVELLRTALGPLAPQGSLFVVSHDRRFKPTFEGLPDCQVRDMTNQTLPEDFRNRRIHRVWRLCHRP